MNKMPKKKDKNVPRRIVRKRLHNYQKNSQSGQKTAPATEGDGRVIFNRSGLATKVAGPFLLKKVMDEL